MKRTILLPLAVVLLGASGTAASANQTYFLTTPGYYHGGYQYQVFGSITTNGASTPTDSDVVGYKITIVQGSPSASYTLIPGNSTFSWTGVTASPTGLTVPTPSYHVVVASNLLCPVGGGKTTSCYQFSLLDIQPGTTAQQKYFYVVLGFGQTDEVAGGFDNPWAVRVLAMVPPDILWTSLHYYAQRVEDLHVGSGNTLLTRTNAAHRLYDVDHLTACGSLNAVVQEARSVGQGHSRARPDSGQVVELARAIQEVIPCPSK
jgi:hypothetical protein